MSKLEWNFLGLIILVFVVLGGTVMTLLMLAEVLR